MKVKKTLPTPGQKKAKRKWGQKRRQIRVVTKLEEQFEQENLETMKATKHTKASLEKQWHQQGVRNSKKEKRFKTVDKDLSQTTPIKIGKTIIYVKPGDNIEAVKERYTHLLNNRKIA